MISDYDFIDANVSGYKERRITSTTELYNKLSATETNNLKDKVNEIVGAVNDLQDANALSIATSFKFIQKGFGNSGLGFEIGDVFCGWSNDGTIRFTEALYEGGLLTDSANFTPIIQTIV